MLPQNTVQGSCRAFNERMQSPGITKKSGKTQAGWGGYTAFEVRFDAKWTWSSVSSGQQGGQVKRCIKVTAVVPNFRLEVAELDILQWEPGSEPTGRCKQAYDDWQRRAMAHEQEHVPRAEAIVRDRNAGWKPRAFTPTVCGTGADAAAALDDAKRAAKERVEDHVRRSAEEIAPVIEENGKEMDKSNKVGFMDCSSCP
ncbi:hypothetical protein [Siccirubricoccus phaeus]|uniref:hypothetical protein n=1 Tax=Siccirubricoccus phaeus TaxID=2595053 RepID=UPI001A9C9A45|nr:hypothetical protein [Siccirubricoccus phaeus]